MDLKQLKHRIQGEVLGEPEILESVQSDFGRIVNKTPAAVVVPFDEADVARCLEFAYRHECPLSVRGSGHCQGGQALNQGGLVLDLDHLHGVDPAREGGAWVGAGARWREVVRRTQPEGWMPPVLTGNLDVTVGGSLTVGGWGAASHRFGGQVDQVAGLKVVTAEGHLVECSREENPQLFDCARAGLGQFGVITSARLRLRPLKSRVKTHYFLYDDLGALLEDWSAWTQMDDVEFVEGWCSPCSQGFRKVGDTRLAFGEWFFPVQVTLASDQGGESPAPSSPRAYRRLGYDNWSMQEFVSRCEPLFDSWRRTGSWQSAHPWIELFLPWARASSFIAAVLKSVPLEPFQAGQVTLLSVKPSDLPTLPMPCGEQVIGFGLRPAVPRGQLRGLLPVLSKVVRLGTEIGARRSLSGWLDFNASEWESHFGEVWPRLAEWKRFYDPKGLLNPGLIPF